MDWFRWWHGTVSDPKFRVVARKSGRPLSEVISIWAAILERASGVTQCDAGETRGSVTGFDSESIDALLDLEDGATNAVFSAMTDKGMIADGRIANWSKRQPKREDTSAERTRAYREREKAKAAASGKASKGDGVERTCDAHVTQRDAPETETETEVNTDNSLRSLSLSGDGAELASKVKKTGKKALTDVSGNLINKNWVVDNVFGPYGEKLPGLPQPVPSRWDSKTAGGKALMARLAEDEKHRDPEFWVWFWTAAASNPHWRGDNGWTPNGIAWFFTRTNFDNVVTRGVDNQKRGITNV